MATDQDKDRDDERDEDDLDESEAGEGEAAPADEREDEEDEDEGDGDEDEDDGAEAEAPAPADADAAPASGAEGEGEEEEEQAAGVLGYRRFVIAGFFGLWMVVAYILGRALEATWSKLAARDWFALKLPSLAAIPHEEGLVSRESISLVLGTVLGALIVFRYYVKPSVRTWADEVAEQMLKVKWPTRKEVGDNTVVVLVYSFILTLSLTILDRFWAFVTNLIYSAGT